MEKERKKIFRRRAGWYLIRLFIRLSGVLPLGLNYFMGSILGNIAYLAVSKHRKIALDSLLVAFPELSLGERKKITRDFFVFMAQGTFELLHSLENLHELENVRIEGREYLEAALKKGKGVIIPTAHLGNFPLMSLKLAKAGFVTNIVTRPMRDERAGGYFHDLRQKAGVKTVFSYPRKECIGGIIKALRANEVVIIQMDQNFGTGGVWVKFFGKLAATPVGPITLALRTGAALVPGYTIRENPGKHCIKILKEEEPIRTSNKNETVLLNAIKLTRMIESWIKGAVCQWSWIHRRWKSRPSDIIKAQEFKIEQ